MKFIQELIWLFTLIFDTIKNYQVLCIGMPINNTMTVQDFFTNIKKYLKNNTCNKTQASLIRNLIAQFTKKLQYDESLVKYITVHAGKRTRRLRTIRQKQRSLTRRLKARRPIAVPRSLRKSSRR